MTESVLVTGANGLMGRATLARLGSSARIYALVREKPERPLPGDAVTIVHDLRAPRDPEPPGTPNTIIHLAQSPRYRDFPDGALDVFDVNIASTQRLLDWACRKGAKRFVYASSGGLYGYGETAFAEDAAVDGHSSPGHYLASKRCAELLSESYGTHMTIVVLRFFFIYGPGQRRTMLMPRLVDNVRRERPIVLQGEHGIRLNPVFADDAAAAVEAAAGLNHSETINVAGPQVLSLREIATRIGEAVGREPCFQAQPGADAKHLIGNTDKMVRLLGAPRIGLVEGIRRMLAADKS